MNLVQNRNDITATTTLADRLGVKLPKELAAQAKHLHQLEQDRPAVATPAQHAATLTAHLGSPTAMAKARVAAAAQLTEAEAANRITDALLDRCAAVLRQRMRHQADSIVAAFAPALQPAIDTLNTDAATLPPSFRADDAATLDPDRYAAWTRVRDAHALLTSVHTALRWLYSTPADDLLAPEAVRSLRYVTPPQFDNSSDVYAFARALAGVVHGGSAVGPVNVDGVFMPTAVAHLGGTFAWATPTELTQRAQALHLAATPVVIERGTVLAS